MRTGKHNDGSGFTLLEMMISMALGLVVLASAVGLYSKAMDANYQVSQRAEMQQNDRVATDLLSRDISVAGYGLPPGGVQLPVGGTSSLIACGPGGCYTGYSAGVGPNGLVYPTVPAYGTNPAVVNTMYGIMTGYRQGISLTNATPASDVITVVYADWTYALNRYLISDWAADGSSVTLNVNSNLPAGVPLPNDPVFGIKAGDVILLSSTNGTVAGEITQDVGADGKMYFANNDPLKINQSGVASGNIKNFLSGEIKPNQAGCVPVAPNPPLPCPNFTATRISVTTYYVDIPRGADGILYTSDDGPPRLMKQINGQLPMPVAENIIGLRLTYDVVDSNGNVTANLVDGGINNVPPVSPNQIRKVNLTMSARTPMRNASGLISGYQTMSLATSVGARGMSFRDRYQ